VRSCGNETLIVIVGALAALWSGQEIAWARTGDADAAFLDISNRDRNLSDHEEILDLIRAGNSAEAANLTRAHLGKTVFYATPRSDKQRVHAPAALKSLT
jgi:DNA-binding GntR family transcriptional regulator